MWQIILRGVPRWVDAGTEQQMRQTMLLYPHPCGCPVVTRLSIIGWQQVPRTIDAHRRIVGGCTSDRGQQTTEPCNGCNRGKFMTRSQTMKNSLPSRKKESRTSPTHALDGVTDYRGHTQHAGQRAQRRCGRGHGVQPSWVVNSDAGNHNTWAWLC